MGCIDSTASRTQKPQDPVPSQKPIRLSTKFCSSDVRVISTEERRNGYKPAYACPICFIYYSKILACTECRNFICFTCFKDYQKKTKDDLRCPFCSSTSSLFIDHELEAHSYFDTTNNGFISKEERKIADQEMANKQPSKLQPINQMQEQRAQA